MSKMWWSWTDKEKRRIRKNIKSIKSKIFLKSINSIKIIEAHHTGHRLEAAIDCKKVVKMDTIVTQDNVNLRKEYNKLNQQLFDGELPTIPLKWSMSKKDGGKVIANGNAKDPSSWKIKHLEISLFIEKNYKEFLGTLAHEMIHVLFFHKGIMDIGGQHGIKFRSKVAELNKKADFKIPISDDWTTKKISKDVQGKDVAVFTRIESGKYFIQVYAVKAMPEVLGKYKQYPDSWKKGKELGVFISNDRDLLKYPVKQKYSTSGRIAWYPIEKEFYERLRKGGKMMQQIENRRIKIQESVKNLFQIIEQTEVWGVCIVPYKGCKLNERVKIYKSGDSIVVRKENGEYVDSFSMRSEASIFQKYFQEE